MPENRENPDQEKLERFQQMQEQAREFADFHAENAGIPLKSPDYPEPKTKPEVKMPAPQEDAVKSEQPISSLEDLNHSLQAGLDRIISGKQDGDPSDWTEMIAQYQDQDPE